MHDMEKVIKGLENTEIMLKQAVDRGGEMAVMGAFKCYNHVSDAIALLKEQENEISRITNEYLNLVKVASKKPEIVRCKNCKKRYSALCIQEEAGNINNPDGWFCADGKRR